MRILHLSTSLDYGGVETHLKLIAGSKLPEGWELTFACLAEGGATEREILALGHRVIVLRQGTSARSLKALYAVDKLIRSTRPTIVHTHGGEANFLGILAASLARAPVRIAEEIGIPTHSSVAKRAFRAIYKHADAVVAVSAQVRDWLLAHREAAPEQVRVIHNPIRTKQYRTYAPSGGPLRLAFVGRLVPVKNLATFLAAFRLVIEEGADAEFVIIGDGPLRGPLQEQVAKSPALRDRVRFLGFVEDPPAELCSCDIFVLPSTHEGFSIALLEAMASGLPALSTRVGVAPEVIEHGKNGWLLPSSDVSAIATYLRGAVALSRSQLQQLGQRAQQVVLGRFSEERYVGEIAQLYEQLIAARRVRGGAGKFHDSR